MMTLKRFRVHASWVPFVSEVELDREGAEALRAKGYRLEEIKPIKPAALLGRKGGKAGRGKAKRRSLEHYQEAQRRSVESRLRNRPPAASPPKQPE